MNFSELCKFVPNQWRAVECADSYRYFLFGGRRGVFKSYLLRWYLVRRLLMWAAQGFRGVRVALCCETLPMLVDRQVVKIETEFPDWLGEIKTTRRAGFGFYFRREYGSGVICFRSLDVPGRFRGPEYAGLAIDELTQNDEFISEGMSLFDVLRGSLRWPGIDDSFLICTSNPDGPGQLWVRKLWIERRFHAGLEKEAKQFFYLKGVVDDSSKHLLPQSYWDMLDSLDERLRRAWVEADWYVSFEGLVYAEFGADNLAHEFEFNRELSYELAFDDGFVDPRVVLFVQRDGRNVFVFDEIYDVRKQDDETVREVLFRCGLLYGVEVGDEIEYDKKIYSREEVPVDVLSAWLVEHEVVLPEMGVGSSEAAALRSRFRKADIPTRGGTHEIVAGIKHMRRQIVDVTGFRILRVLAARCVNFVSELTAGYRYRDSVGGRTVVKADRPQDKDNHGCDALRYWLWLRVSRLE